MVACLNGTRDRQKSYIVDSADIITIARGTDDANWKGNKVAFVT